PGADHLAISFGDKVALPRRRRNQIAPLGQREQWWLQQLPRDLRMAADAVISLDVLRLEWPDLRGAHGRLALSHGEAGDHDRAGGQQAKEHGEDEPPEGRADAREAEADDGDEQAEQAGKHEQDGEGGEGRAVDRAEALRLRAPAA